VTLRRPPVLAGRHAEQAALHAAWDEGRVVLLEGEAGMGKSRLLADWLATVGPGTLQAAGRPGDGGAPYSTLARLLRPILTPAPARLSSAARAALALVGAEAGTRSETAPALGPGALQSAVAELLDSAGITTVALDDLHFADAATLELLSGLAAVESPRRWLLAQRPAEIPLSGPALRDDLLELQRLVVVNLQPLDEAATAELVDALAVPGLQGPALASALVRHSGGNPLFLLETLKQGLTDGSLARGELPRPAGVGSLIERRLQRLGEDALTLARVAAIAGVDFDIELAEAATGRSAVQLASAWQELQEAQVLRNESFAHDLVADAVLRGVPSVVARRVHAQCAAWLAGRGSEAARVARHWQLGGHARQAAQAYATAAGRAARTSRLPEAAALHGLAAEQYEAAGDVAQAFEARLERLNALINGDAREDVIAQARTLQAAATTDLQRVQAARIEVDLLAHRGLAGEAIARGLEALALARRIDAHQEQAWLATPLTGCLVLQGRAAEAAALLLPLQDWIEQHGDALERARYLGLRGQVLAAQGRLRESIQWRERGLAIEREANVQVLVATSLQHLAVGWGQLGQPLRAERAAREAALACDPADRGGLREAVLRFTHARYLVDLGHYAPALDHLEAVLPLLQGTAATFWAEAVTLLQAQAWLRLGQAARARPAALAADDDDSHPRLRAQRRQLRLELAPLLGQGLQPAWREEALALVGGDQGAGLDVQVAVLRALPPQALLPQAARLAHLAREQERQGLELAALAWQADAAAAQHEPDRIHPGRRAAITALRRDIHAHPELCFQESAPPT
jgi:tetratricopeptide (TPR) repeat protein